jgi:gas vesicle protein
LGLGIGGVLGLLLAPASGEDTRDFIRDSAEDAVEAAGAEARRLSRHFQNTIESAEEQVKDAANSGAKAYQEVKKASAQVRR